MMSKLTDDSVALILGVGGIVLSGVTLALNAFGDLEPQIAITGVGVGNTALGGAFGLAKGGTGKDSDPAPTVAPTDTPDPGFSTIGLDSPPTIEPPAMPMEGPEYFQRTVMGFGAALVEPSPRVFTAKNQPGLAWRGKGVFDPEAGVISWAAKLRA